MYTSRHAADVEPKSYAIFVSGIMLPSNDSKCAVTSASVYPVIVPGSHTLLALSHISVCPSVGATLAVSTSLSALILAAAIRASALVSV